MKKNVNMRKLADECAWIVADKFELHGAGVLGEEQRTDLGEAIRTILLAFKKGKPFHGICLKGDPNG